MKRRSFLAGIAALGVGSKLGPLPAATPATPVPAAVPAPAATSIIATGGWCAPSEIIYDLVQRRSELDDDFIEAASQLTIRRGGIKFHEEA